MENVLSMLAPKPRYRPATPCSLRIFITIARAPVPLARDNWRGAPGRWADDEGVGAVAVPLAAGDSTSVWMRVLTL
jgi:hypothetical protein